MIGKGYPLTLKRRSRETAGLPDKAGDREPKAADPATINGQTDQDGAGIIQPHREECWNDRRVAAGIQRKVDHD